MARFPAVFHSRLDVLVKAAWRRCRLRALLDRFGEFMLRDLGLPPAHGTGTVTNPFY